MTLPQQVFHFCNGAALVLIGLSVLAGIGVFGLWIRRRRSPDVVALEASLIFLAVGLTLVVGFIQLNQKVSYQPQSRYFFILLLPAALLLTGGICALAATRALRLAVVAILFVGVGLLNAFALVTVSKAGVATGGVRQSLHRTKP